MRECEGGGWARCLWFLQFGLFLTASSWSLRVILRRFKCHLSWVALSNLSGFLRAAQRPRFFEQLLLHSSPDGYWYQFSQNLLLKSSIEPCHIGLAVLMLILASPFVICSYSRPPITRQWTPSHSRSRCSQPRRELLQNERMVFPQLGQQLGAHQQGTRPPRQPQRHWHLLLCNHW